MSIMRSFDMAIVPLSQSGEKNRGNYYSREDCEEECGGRGERKEGVKDNELQLYNVRLLGVRVGEIFLL